MYSLKKVFTYLRTWGLKSSFKNLFYTIQNRETIKHFGSSNPDKKIYVIRCINDKSRFYIGPVHNLLANYFYVLTHIHYAHENGYIPVIDQQNYPVYNSLEKPVNGTMNAWEYFWEQPGDISLAEAYKSKNVILSKRKWFYQWDMGYDAAKYRDAAVINDLHRLTVKLNKATQEYVQQRYNELLEDQGRVLGVCFRYGGHSKNCTDHGNGHPIQPEIRELAEIVKQRMSEWHMDKVFFTSDSIESVDFFKQEFGNKIIIMPRIREKEGQQVKMKDSAMYCENNIFNTTIDYLSEMELLARCDALIGSITSGLRYAIVKNNMNYNHCEILERGFFEDKRKVKL